MSLNLHVPVTPQDIVNDLNRQIEALRNENSSLRIQLQYILNCVERIPKEEREKVGLIEENEVQKMQQQGSSKAKQVKKTGGQPKVG